MSTRPSGADGPEDIDAAFAQIVAGLQDEIPKWPEQGTSAPDETGESGSRQADSTSPPRESPPPREYPPTGGARPDSAARDGRGHDPVSPEPPPGEPVDDDEHFVPPEPPPVPRPRAATVAALSLIGLGVLLLVVPQLMGLGATAALPLGLIVISGGIGWLILRKRQDPPSESDLDDGAQL